MNRPKIIKIELDFDKDTLWAYFDLERKGGGYKKFGINKWYYMFQAKIDFNDKDKCKDYLKKRANEYLEQLKNNYSKMKDEVILSRGNSNKFATELIQ